jgi:branched-subunit amino acid permease
MLYEKKKKMKKKKKKKLIKEKKKKSLVVSRNLEVVLHGLDAISVVNNHVLDRIKVYGQGVLVVESDASHFTYGRISILIPG